MRPALFVRKPRPMTDQAMVSLGPVLSVVGIVLGAIISILVLAALAPDFFAAVGSIVENLSTADLGSPLANTIAGIIAILVPLVLLFGFVALIFKASKLGGKKD